MKFQNIFGFICGILLLVMFTLSVANNANAVDDDSFMSPESIVRGLYDSVTFDPGSTPDWDYVRKFFLLEAVFAVRMTQTSMANLNVEEFVGWFEGDIENTRWKKEDLRKPFRR